MALMTRLRRGLAPVLVLLTAAGPVSAQPNPRRDRVVDGVPTAQACARYGYDLNRADRDDRRGRYAMASAAPPPPPPPPPPPVAYESAVEELVVTGSPIPQPGLTTPRPGDVETERYPDATINPVKRTAEAPVSTFSIDVDTASYANVRRFLNEGRTPPRDAVRVEEMINYFDYGYPRPAAGEAPFRPFVAVVPSPWSPSRQIIHIGLQGYEPPKGERPPLNLTFLVDVSGSMWSEDRLPLARKALNMLVDGLRPEDRVSIVVYAGAAGAVLEPTPGTQKLKMRCALEALQAGGSTAGGAGLALAYDLAERNLEKRAVNRVILLTDGDFNVGVADPEKLEDFVADKRRTGVYLSVYGFGRGNYNDTMMQTLSQAGNGVAAYVDGMHEAKKLFRDEFERSAVPIADDVKIQVEFNPARVAEYRLIGYETRALNREDFNNDQVDAGETGAGASVTALYEITPVGGPASVDPLRYQAETRPAPAGGGELAFLRIRYKLPGGTDSRLIERPITDADRARRLEAAPRSTRFALAVAGFGQRLRGDPWMAEGFGYDDIQALARGAVGDDPDGLRAGFLELVDAAGKTRPINAQ